MFISNPFVLVGYLVLGVKNPSFCVLCELFSNIHHGHFTFFFFCFCFEFLLAGLSV